MIKNVIFDVDGTLIDSNKLHAEAWQKAFAEYGKEVEFETVLRQIGKGGDQLIPVFLSEKEIDEFGENLEKYRGELFKKEYLLKVKAFPHVRELVEKIKNDGKKVVLASSAAEEELEEFKKIMNIADLLDDETSSDDAESCKPEPDIFLAALKKLGNPPKDECVVVGDTPYDGVAAGKAGLQVIGLTCGGWNAEDLREAGCVEIYKSPTDLLDWLEESLINQNAAKSATEK
jgi:HAD superfamily hydrolase (TIGR01549 family)